MSGRCQIPADKICWEPPSTAICDPCVDLSTPEGKAEFDEAWFYAAAWMYQKTGSQWPGECFVERARPCVPRCGCRCPQDCDCGSYNYLSLADAGFCLPIVELLGVNIHGGACCPCNETGVLRPCDQNVRLETVHSQPRIVLQSVDGCCPSWWPQQDLCRPDGAECTWSVDVRTGCAPPPDVLAVTANLAVEMIKECLEHHCQIGEGATRVTTRGVTYERDPEKLGNGFWWSMMQDIVDTDRGVVEQFCGAEWCQSVEWHHVFGPERFSVVDCVVVPFEEVCPPFGVGVCGSCQSVDCMCSDAEFSEAAKAVAAYAPGFQ